MTIDPYDVFIHEKLLPCSPRTGRQRQQIMSFIRSLSSNPFQDGDYPDTDPAGNPLNVKIMGKYAVSYYVDHAVKEVKIVNIHPADEE